MLAKFFIASGNGIVKCQLCPHECIIKNGEYGICNVRSNVSGVLITKNYGVISSKGFDPIEKKPLYHFYPGKEILSVGSLGCNLKCQFCQNWQISQCGVGEFEFFSKTSTPEEIVELALSKKNNIGIAFTYNEPTIFYEFMYDTAILAKKNNLKTAVVSNGFINPEPLSELIPFIDAFNIDLKSFSDEFYVKYTKAKLNPVLQTLKTISIAKKHLEITNLVISDLNDSIDEFEKMVVWIKDNLGEGVVLHISRYFPNYKLDKDPTNINRLNKLFEIAKKHLHFVYLGNVQSYFGSSTLCPDCGELLISRTGYNTRMDGLNINGKCKKCNSLILKNI